MPRIADVDIANLALDQIAQTNITSLNDGTNTAAIVSRHYNQTVRNVLRSGRWKSARGKLQLAQRADLVDPSVQPPVASTGSTQFPQVGGWPPGTVGTVVDDGPDPDFNAPEYGDPQMAYAFQLPADYLRLVRFNDVDSTTTSYPFWEIRGNILWTNQTTAFLEYVRDVQMTTPGIGVLDPDLQDVIVMALAARLSWVFQQSTKLQDSLLKRYDQMLRSALAIDARSERVALRSPYIDSNWIRSRWVSTNH